MNGINRLRPRKRVRHADLERAYATSAYKSVCPECKVGVLLVVRDFSSLRPLRNDRCTICCQRFIYTDLSLGNELFHVPLEEVS